jgi:hypothetical protein
MEDPYAQRQRDNQQVESHLLYHEDRLLAYTVRQSVKEGVWLTFIQDFEHSLTHTAPHLLVILRLRRQYRNHRGRRGWTAPVQTRFPHELAALTGKPAEDHFKVSRNTFQNYWREVVDLAAREAIRKGLL